MIGIAEMFVELDGTQRMWEQLEIVFPILRARQQERWRENKRLQRASKKTRDSYAARWKNDAAFRERRRAYWRDYDVRRGRTKTTRRSRSESSNSRYMLAAKQEIARRIAARSAA